MRALHLDLPFGTETAPYSYWQGNGEQGDCSADQKSAKRQIIISFQQKKSAVLGELAVDAPTQKFSHYDQCVTDHVEGRALHNPALNGCPVEAHNLTEQAIQVQVDKGREVPDVLF